MNNKSNKMKTILFASLIAAMILPFSVMQMASADNDRQNKINELGNAFEKVYLKYMDEDNPKAKAGLKNAMDDIVKDLEEYGITYTEKWESNKAY